MGDSLFSAQENLVISRSVSCETVKTEDSGKPRSHKKVKAPQPPVSATPASATLAPATLASTQASTDVTASTLSNIDNPSLSEPHAITDVLCLSTAKDDKRGQLESVADEPGKVLYRSKGYEDTGLTVGQNERQNKINIRDTS